ncbi:MAG: hypothetical protein SGCHY_004119 [Lobulomycetales sp.]
MHLHLLLLFLLGLAANGHASNQSVAVPAISFREESGDNLRRTLVASPFGADAELVVANGSRIPAHSLLLRLYSPFYDALFSPVWRKGAADSKDAALVIHHPDVSYVTMIACLEYMYAGSFVLSEGQLVALLEESGKLLIRGLGRAVISTVGKWSMETRVSVLKHILASPEFDALDAKSVYHVGIEEDRTLNVESADFAGIRVEDMPDACSMPLPDLARFAVVVSLHRQYLATPDLVFNLLKLLENGLLLPVLGRQCLDGQRNWRDMAIKAVYTTVHESPEVSRLIPDPLRDSVFLGWYSYDRWYSDDQYLRLVSPTTRIRLVLYGIKQRYKNTASVRRCFYSNTFINEATTVSLHQGLHTSSELESCLGEIFGSKCFRALYRIATYTSSRCRLCSVALMERLQPGWYKDTDYLETLFLNSTVRDLTEYGLEGTFLDRWLSWDALLHIFTHGLHPDRGPNALKAERLCEIIQIFGPLAGHNRTFFHVAILPVLKLAGYPINSITQYTMISNDHSSAIIKNWQGFTDKIRETSVSLRKADPDRALDEKWKLVFRLSDMISSHPVHPRALGTIDRFFYLANMVLSKMQELMQVDQPFAIVSRQDGQVYAAVYCDSRPGKACPYNFLIKYNRIWLPVAPDLQWVDVINEELDFPQFFADGFRAGDLVFNLEPRLHALGVPDLMFEMVARFHLSKDSGYSTARIQEQSSSEDFEIEVFWLS